MTKKYNSKFIAGLAVPICLTITTTGISNPILNTKLNIAYAQGEQSEGFKIYEAEIGGSGSLEFSVEGKDSSNDIFNKYWKNVDQVGNWRLLLKVKIHQIHFLRDTGIKLINY